MSFVGWRIGWLCVQHRDILPCFVDTLVGKIESCFDTETFNLVSWSIGLGWLIILSGYVDERMKKKLQLWQLLLFTRRMGKSILPVIVWRFSQYCCWRKWRYSNTAPSQVLLVTATAHTSPHLISSLLVSHLSPHFTIPQLLTSPHLLSPHRFAAHQRI